MQAMGAMETNGFDLILNRNHNTCPTLKQRVPSLQERAN
ncbi:unnamed protein product [Prunus brigantina]